MKGDKDIRENKKVMIRMVRIIEIIRPYCVVKGELFKSKNQRMNGI